MLALLAAAAFAGYTDDYGVIYDSEEKKTIIGYDPAVFCGLMVVPDSVDRIAKNAFEGCHFSDYIRIPASVLTVETEAFKGSRGRVLEFTGAKTSFAGKVFDGASFKTVTLAVSEPKLEKDTFANLAAELLNFSTSNQVFEEFPVFQVTKLGFYGSDITLGKDLFKTGQFTHLYLGATNTVIRGKAPPVVWFVDEVSLKEVAAGAFEGAKTFGQWKFASGIAKIEARVFANAVLDVETIEIPASVTECASDAFVGCAGIKTFSVAQESTSFVSEDGVVFDHDKTKVILFPSAKTGEYTIPATVKEIGEGSLAGNSLSAFKVGEGSSFTVKDDVLFTADGATVIAVPGAKETVTLNDVTSVGPFAFAYTKTTKETAIPQATTIGQRAFEKSSAAPKELTLSGAKVGEFAFASSGVTKVTISGNSQLSNNAFGDCQNLETVTINGDKVVIGAAFSGSRINDILTITSSDATITGLVGNGYCKTVNIAGSTVSVSVDLADSPACIGTINVDGTTFTSLPPSGFAGYNCEGAVILGTSITAVPAGAFADAIGITRVTFKGSVSSIDSDAFRGCTKVAEFVVEQSEQYKSQSGIVYLASSGEIVLFPLGATGTVTITSEMTIGSASVFCGASCTSFATDNSKYAVVDGILYTADKKAVVACPAGFTGAVTIPSGVQEINAFAFAGSRAESVQMTEIQQIHENAFAYAQISTLDIASSCVISQNAFKNSNVNRLVLSGNGIKVSAGALSQMTPNEIVVSGSNIVFESQAVTNTTCPTISISGTENTISTGAFDSCKIQNFIVSGRNILLNTNINTNSDIQTFTISGSVQVTGPVVDAVTGNYVAFEFQDAEFISVASGAFGGFAVRGTVVFPDGITTVEQNAFTSVRGVGLTNDRITYPSTLTSVGENAFAGSAMVSQLEFQSKSLTLGNRSFAGCTGLKDVWFSADEADIQGIADSFVEIPVLPTFHYGTLAKDEGMLVGLAISMSLIGLSILVTIIVCIRRRRRRSDFSIDSKNQSLFDD